MLPNTLGKDFVITSFGESHGRCVGIVVDGCPAGLEVSEQDIQIDLDRRKPGTSLVSSLRREEDRVEILSGIFEGHTTGAPICMLIWNSDVRSGDYGKVLEIPRPGHSDYTAFQKYGGLNDWRGGGRFSGRITAGYVMAGAIAKKLLMKTLGVEILAYSIEIGGVRAEKFNIEEIRKNRYSNEARSPDLEAAERMKKVILEERTRGDSVGGIVECLILNLPVGIGEPVFSSIESELSKAIFSIPAAKAIEFGSGFQGTRWKGSENNDPYSFDERTRKIITRTNNSGGILGGLSNGMPVIFRVGFKPASSIAKLQRTLNISKMQEDELVVPGRHDPTVVPRAVPVIEGMTAVVMADLALQAGLIRPVLKMEPSSSSTTTMPQSLSQKISS
jgi:chorismate synthase